MNKKTSKKPIRKIQASIRQKSVEGVGPNHLKFIDSFGIEINALGIATIKKNSPLPFTNIRRDSVTLFSAEISNLKGEALRNAVRSESESILKNIGITIPVAFHF